MSNWISVKTKRPPCSRNPDAPGTPVLYWPVTTADSEAFGMDGFCYYGRRATGRPEFYLFGAVVPGVTHWQPMPKGPKS